MEVDRSLTARLFRESRDRWPLMTAYERFEQVVALVLSFIIAAVIVLALVQIVVRVLPLLISGWSGHLGVRGVPSAVRHGHDTPDRNGV